MYRVIREFCDLQDATETKDGMIFHQYRAGDTYPRKGLTPSEGRIAELAGPDNAQGQPLIEAVVSSADSDTEAEKSEKGKRKPRKKSEE